MIGLIVSLRAGSAQQQSGGLIAVGKHAQTQIREKVDLGAVDRLSRCKNGDVTSAQSDLTLRPATTRKI